MKAVAREFVGRDVVAQAASGGDLRQQISEEVDDLLPCMGNMLTSVQEGHEFFGSVSSAVVRDEAVALEYRLEPLAAESLQERKRQKARNAIITAACELSASTGSTTSR